MKIILSPSKTATYKDQPLFNGTPLLYPKQTKKLVAVIRKLSQKEMAKALSIKGDLLKQTFMQYKNFHRAETYPAFPSYNGLVYKQIPLNSYQAKEIQYIKQHVRILDALYGVLEPDTLITPYRLDMKAKLDINLYHFWDIDTYFEEEPIINLASTEFSSMVHRDMINISFLQEKNGRFVNQATYSKMARGTMLHYMVVNNVTNINEIKAFNEDGYSFNQELSTADTITFTR